MPKPQYRESAQYQALRTKLNDAGCRVQTQIQQLFDSGNQRASIEKLLVFRKVKPPVGIVVIDWPKDGYALYLADNHRSHDEAIAAIMALD